MRILIISAEVWRDDTNGGNVLSNIFDGLDATFAQIYCNPGMPDNKICYSYFQLTDKMMIQSVFQNKKPGKEFKISNYAKLSGKTLDVENNTDQPKIFSIIKKFNNFGNLARQLLWSIGRWKNEEFNKFVINFNPDIIFAPCYSGIHMQAITRYVSTLTNAPIVSYISDDSYSLKQFSISPLFWINRFLIRSNLRKTFKHYKLVYTMTEEQKEEYDPIFNCNMKILRKGVELNKLQVKNSVNKPIRIIYAGGIYLNRWKILKSIAKVLTEINKEEIIIELHIYTSNKISDNLSGILDDKRNSFMHGIVSKEELGFEYKNSDIALHVESFDLKNRLITRLSFSTKIVDCLSSGCAVMAVSWKRHAGYKYLKDNDAAICVDNIKDLYSILLNITKNKEIILDYSLKAKQTCIANHSNDKNSQMIMTDFKYLINNSKRDIIL